MSPLHNFSKKVIINNVNKVKTKELTTLAMLSAITILLGVIPNIGIIQIGPVSFTILHIPVIIAAIMYGIKGGVLISFVFGLTSFFVAITRAYTPIDLLFINPLISVVPRALFGLVSGLLARFFYKGDKLEIKSCLIAFASTFIHSLFVYFFLYIFGRQELGEEVVGSIKNLLLFLLSIFSINALVEAIVASIIVFIVVKSLKSNKKVNL